MIVSRFPSEWLVEVTVKRGGRDRKGNPLPATNHQVDNCLSAWRSTDNPVDRADLTSDEAVLYGDDPMADFADGDQVTIPAGPWPSGVWVVDGEPKRWPLGCEVPLRKGV